MAFIPDVTPILDRCEDSWFWPLWTTSMRERLLRRIGAAWRDSAQSHKC